MSDSGQIYSKDGIEERDIRTYSQLFGLFRLSKTFLNNMLKFRRNIWINSIKQVLELLFGTTRKICQQFHLLLEFILQKSIMDSHNLRDVYAIDSIGFKIIGGESSSDEILTTFKPFV